MLAVGRDIFQCRYGIDRRHRYHVFSKFAKTDKARLLTSPNRPSKEFRAMSTDLHDLLVFLVLGDD